MMTTLNNNQNPNPKIKEELVVKEHLHQEKLSFNLALNLTRISAIIIVASVGLLLSGTISEKTATTAGELASKLVIVGLQMTKYTNERGDK
ncbi:MAG: hypothetical protein F6K54_19265 [Okeania sp. SIO3B5]|uniref:TRADD-N-associated membrane domain-containing protein n=1 Tax=Okeania sp. SIO3B5 TaxID=2607811 RepID=UPI001400AC69|nr:hypothetical protein [Okeania sp. SIO3B5]NEO55026.1 hypothetical protein [Okeania sp. SIO3B5]